MTERRRCDAMSVEKIFCCNNAIRKCEMKKSTLKQFRLGMDHCVTIPAVDEIIISVPRVASSTSARLCEEDPPCQKLIQESTTEARRIIC